MRNVEIICNILHEGKRILAIDGRCTSGKTTLAEQIEKSLPCNIVHIDDFYLPFSKRTKEVMATPGGNIDFERFEEEILLPLKEGKHAIYRPYDAHKDEYLSTGSLRADLPTIIEGSYSCHPKLRAFYDYTIFLDVSKETQQTRLLSRNPERFEQFETIWIPREEDYFTTYNIVANCMMRLWGETNLAHR